MCKKRTVSFTKRIVAFKKRTVTNRANKVVSRFKLCNYLKIRIVFFFRLLEYIFFYILVLSDFFSVKNITFDTMILFKIIKLHFFVFLTKKKMKLIVFLIYPFHFKASSFSHQTFPYFLPPDILTD